jgi:hypothetical protein
VDGPRTPYRDGKALAEIIPPDRRRVKTLALVLGSMVLGVALWGLGGMVLAPPREPTPPPLGPPAIEGAPLDAEAVRRIVATHTVGLKRACWEPRLADRDGPSAASVTVAVTIGRDGKVDATRTTGDDAPLQRCLEAQIVTWRFPASRSPTTVNIPLRFAKE